MVASEPSKSYLYVIGLGSNLGDRHETISKALASIASLDSTTILRVSKLIDSNPIGAADQPFINGACTCVSVLDPQSMMRELLSIEKSLGRVRDVKWGNRTIDLDILRVFGESGVEMSMTTDSLTVPHPRLEERDFARNPAQEVLGQNRSRSWTWSILKDLFVEWPKRIDRRFLYALLIGVFVRLFFAATIPFGNDEAYYWDWGRHVQLSYFDHPPMVSWVSYLGQWILPAGSPTLSGRLLIPLIHAVACLFLFDMARFRKGGVLSRTHVGGLIVLTQLTPAFSLGGFFLMPDATLLLFATMALWFMQRAIKLPVVSGVHGLVLGVFWGLAGLSKYHAAALAVGAIIYFGWQRYRTDLGNKNSDKTTLGFWLALIVTGILVTMPVWIWNAQNNWVSLLFQGGRGLSGEGLRLTPALRSWLGVALFIGPMMCVGAFVLLRRFCILKVFFKKERDCVADGRDGVLVFAALPLLVLLLGFSLTSEILPHWPLPAFWVLIPLIVSFWDQSRSFKRLQKPAMIYGVVFCIGVPLVLSSVDSRRALVGMFNGKPGGLGELTLWDEASRDQDLVQYIFDKTWLSQNPLQACDDGIVYLGARWFTVAQAAANLPGNPRIRSADPDKLSYYNYRDNSLVRSACPAVLLSEAKHVEGVLQSGALQVFEQKIFIVSGHDDRPIYVVRGRYSSNVK
jgi:2-amino-4-hydroxy-6-hydroxymethyldihydropteridine diphosphokinase